MSGSAHVHVFFEDHEQLRSALLLDLQPPGLRVPALDSLVVGESVLVELDVRGSGSIELAGTVIWRQVRGIAGSQPGVGIQFGRYEARWLEFVESAAPQPPRRSLAVSFVVQSQETLREGTVRDLSVRGALLSADPLPGDDMVLALRLRSPRVSPIVAARVVRREGAGVWIEILSARPAALRFWEGLVAAQDA